MTTTVLPAATVLTGTARAEGSAAGNAVGGTGSLAADVTYERIAGAIAAVTVHGTQVRVHWKDPHTGAPMGESSATMATDHSLGARLQAQARRSAVQETVGNLVGNLVGAIVRALVDALGGVAGGSAGRVARDVVYTASHDLQARALSAVAYTDADRREAVVRAFAAVQHAFRWDERAGRFVAR